MRHILKLHRDLNADSLPQADHDYTIETFNPAIHKQQWLDLNNTVFVHHPDHASKGIARALSVEAINYLVNKGLKHAILYVDADNEKGLKLYGSLGFN